MTHHLPHIKKINQVVLRLQLLLAMILLLSCTAKNNGSKKDYELRLVENDTEQRIVISGCDSKGQTQNGKINKQKIDWDSKSAEGVQFYMIVDECNSEYLTYSLYNNHQYKHVIYGQEVTLKNKEDGIWNTIEVPGVFEEIAYSLGPEEMIKLSVYIEPIMHEGRFLLEKMIEIPVEEDGSETRGVIEVLLSVEFSVARKE